MDSLTLIAVVAAYVIGFASAVAMGLLFFRYGIPNDDPGE